MPKFVFLICDASSTLGNMLGCPSSVHAQGPLKTDSGGSPVPSICELPLPTCSEHLIVLKMVTDSHLSSWVLNWCHDSRALASRLHRSPLAETNPTALRVWYSWMPGFLDKGKGPFMQQFGVWPQYYANPKRCSSSILQGGAGDQ